MNEEVYKHFFCVKCKRILKCISSKLYGDDDYKMLVGEFYEFLSDYQQYIRRFDVGEIHNGYFSIDKKVRSVNSEVKRGRDTSDDISAYDLILKNKECLLSFDAPTRFIFSHSVLREGWDNPNVFQIYTLRHANSATAGIVSYAEL